MTREPSVSIWLWETIHTFIRAIPIASFTLALLFDIAYWNTSNLLWLHFAEWLLLAGALMTGIDLILCLIELPVRRVRPTWPAVISGVVVLILAVLNNLVHTADGWTAVVPWGLTLSVATVLVMALTAWLARGGERHV